MIRVEMLSSDIINYEEGFKRFAENRALYERYLLRFLDDRHLADGQSALQAKDYKEMMMQMHPFKGMAGTLGMDRLYLACDEVVKALRRQQEENLVELMEQVEQEYQRVMTLLNQAVQE